MEQLLENLIGFRGEIRQQEPMSEHTSWKLGGPAELMLVPESRSDLQLALRQVCRSKLPWLVVGNGSNLLVADEGIRGVVIKLEKLNRIEFLPGGRVEVEAGVLLSRLIKSCGKAGLGGLEELSGIPGTLGGAIVMNAGALNTEIADRVSQVYLTDGHGEWALRREQISFAYRSSGLFGKGIVSGAMLHLEEISTADSAKREEKALERRVRVQNVPGAHAGSVFKNPPKQKAWQLIDQAGLRGRKKGGAEVSEVHCNHIVNHGGATAAEVKSLIEEVQAEVKKTTGVALELEVRLVGWES